MVPVKKRTSSSRGRLPHSREKGGARAGSGGKKNFNARMVLKMRTGQLHQENDPGNQFWPWHS